MSLPHFIRVIQAAERGLFDIGFLADGVGIRFHDEPKGALSRTAIRTSDPALRPGDGDEEHRPRGDRLDDLQRALSRRPEIRFARSYQRRECGLECRDIRHRHGSAQFQPRCRPRLRRALRPGRRIRRGGSRALGQLGGRCLRSRQGFRDQLRPGEAACAQPQRHNGPHFKVAGPLNVARTPQGAPVIVQAGASDQGRELAAATADVVYAAAQTLEAAHKPITPRSRAAWPGMAVLPTR
jgi:alkanesulfonate monooxygenase SsuD/methylene tetrahydromethanopterin reductase-like flavin-dependent oxidoreductase (luciferase family)